MPQTTAHRYVGEHRLGNPPTILCPRCSNGLPICKDRRPDGSHYSHADTCATYRWGTDVCRVCAHELGWD